MSATVTYGGQTLATVENKTRVFETAGTYMEDDLTVTDVTSGGGPSTTTVVFGQYSTAEYGALTVYTDGDGVIHYSSADSGNWGMGSEDQVVMQSGSTLITLSSTSFDMTGTWVYSLISGLTLVARGSFMNMRTTTYYLIFQVD